ncbi:transcriptional regulator GlxA family with amidase domain [Azospirillum fermentarium]|uniref:GlxA family transcriptional regulator n=1 Tax=Azospirillum fermentarium TaxID=1233114 RepID=UPI0022280CC3|nr:helix-turn-helix domain-containing protein [Azospirillum fermentarium]MCW2248353.1 transcriptional regulator GlxA family with amidase domain [Azospirillum fermentarium]
MTESNRPPHVGVLIYPGAQMSAVLGLTDLFAVADSLARKRLGVEQPVLRVSHLGSTPDHRGVAALFDTHGGTGGDPDVIILPPSLGDPPSGPALAPLAGWLKEKHAGGAALASVCAGAFLLGETGLLAGRTVTTHWLYAGPLATRFPEARVDTRKLLVDTGDVITAGGLMAWTDLGLLLLDRLLDPAAMVETARYLLIDPPGRDQRCYGGFVPRLDHGDEPVLKVQRWLEANGTGGMTVGAMAAQAGLEERTFLRRFRAATGLRPIEYCQHLRIAKAREMLETTNTAVERIGWDVGYDDPASFRKLFLKLTGLTPSTYRRRFGVSRGRSARSE